MPFLGLATQGDNDEVRTMTNTVRDLVYTVNQLTEQAIALQLPPGTSIEPKVGEGLVCVNAKNVGADELFAFCRLPSDDLIVSDGPTVYPKGKCFSAHNQQYCLIEDDSHKFYNKVMALANAQKDACKLMLSQGGIGKTYAEKCTTVYENELNESNEFDLRCCTMLGADLLQKITAP